MLLSINCKKEKEKKESLRSEGSATNHLTEWRVNEGSGELCRHFLMEWILKPFS